MPRGWFIEDPSATYFLTFRVVDWVDVFSRKNYRDIVCESLTYCRKIKGLRLWGFVVMTNHIHTILSAREGNLPDIIRDFKRHTASRILEEIQTNKESRRDWMMKRFEFAARRHVRCSPHQFWEHNNHPKILHTVKFTSQKLNYIHMNPVKAGFVDKPEDWVYSSARNYLLLPPLMEIDLLDINY
jgi:REP element-mobilizing transposase RayT